MTDFIVLYFITSAFLAYVLFKDEFFWRLPVKMRGYVLLGCLAMPGIFYLPFALDTMEAYNAIPWWLFSGPFLAIGGAGLAVMIFYPEKQQDKKLIRHFIYAIFGAAAFIQLLPLLYTLMRRWGLWTSV